MSIHDNIYLNSYYREVFQTKVVEKIKTHVLCSICVCVCVCVCVWVGVCVCVYIYIYLYICTGCPRRNVPDFGRVFLMFKYTDITQNTYVQS